MSTKKGFTLIELLVVISIISLLSSVVLSSLNTARNKAKIAAGKQFEANVYHAAGDQAIGMWEFIECSGSAAADTSGNNGTATLVGSPTWSSDTPNSRGCSLSLNGSSQYVTVPSSTALSATGDLTITIWVKPGSTQVTYADLLSKHGAGGYVIEQSGASTNNFSFGWDSTGSGSWSGVGPVSLVANQWQHLAVVKSGATVNIYINGAVAATGTGSSATISTGGLNLVIGNWPHGGRAFNGFVGPVRMYAKSLTAMDVRNIYAMESAGSEVARN